MDIKLIEKNNVPTVVVMRGSKIVCVPVKHALAIAWVNQFLRRLNTGLDIKFESYSQYGELLMDVTEALETRAALA